MRLEKSWEKKWENVEKETESVKDVHIRRQVLCCMLGTARKMRSCVQGAHRILSLVGGKQNSRQHVHMEDTWVGSGSCWEEVSTERASAAKRSKEQMDNEGSGKLDASSLRDLHTQLLDSAALSRKNVCSGATGCDAT